MKAKIKKYEKGFLGEGATPYSLRLEAENDEELLLLKKLNRFMVVWVSPHRHDKEMAWWGKV